MDEFTLVEKYFKKLTNKNPSALDLNDDVFFDKKKNKLLHAAGKVQRQQKQFYRLYLNKL